MLPRILLNHQRNTRGMTLLEVLVIFAVCTVIILALTQVLLTSNKTSRYSSQIVTFNAYAESILSAVQSLVNQSGNQCGNIFQLSSTSYLTNAPGPIINPSSINLSQLGENPHSLSPPQHQYNPIPIGFNPLSGLDVGGNTSNLPQLPREGRRISGAYYQLWLVVPYGPQGNPPAYYDACLSPPTFSNANSYNPPQNSTYFCQGDLYLEMARSKGDFGVLSQTRWISGLIFSIPSSSGPLLCGPGVFNKGWGAPPPVSQPIQQQVPNSCGNNSLITGIQGTATSNVTSSSVPNYTYAPTPNGATPYGWQNISCSPVYQ